MTKEKEILLLTDKAKKTIPSIVDDYSSLMGIDYGKITIRKLKSRWGSCSACGNLSFNCLLMLTPEYIQRYVVVHELAHRKEMNHSARFWKIVKTVLPDYRNSKEWLETNGVDIIQTMFDDTLP